MKTKDISPIVSAAAAAGSVHSAQAQAQSAWDLVAQLKSKDEEVRGNAWAECRSGRRRRHRAGRQPLDRSRL